jgi:outer membrane protein W
MKKATAFVFLSLAAAGLLAASGTGPLQLTLFGGLGHSFAYGSASNYAMGSNDFPVTPAHTPPALGAALSFSLSRRLALELRGEYTMASTLTLTDPSDQDTVSINSSKHVAGSLNLIWELSEARFRPYLTAGGGLDKISAEAVTAVSQNGYDVTFGTPAKTLSAFAEAGGGLKIMLSAALGLRVDARYRILFSSPDKVHSLIGSAGLVWRF